MENNENNPFINAMTSGTSESTNQLNSEKSDMPISLAPERFLRGLATFTLLFGIVAGAFMFICALGLIGDDIYKGLILLGSACVVAFISIIGWAIMKVFTNISCNLFNIVAELKKNR